MASFVLMPRKKMASFVYSVVNVVLSTITAASNFTLVTSKAAKIQLAL